MKILLKVIAVFSLGILMMIPEPGSAESGPAPARQRESAKSNAPYTKDDIAVEVLFGREVAARLVGRYGLYDKPDVTRYVNLVGYALAQSTNRPELEFRFGVLDSDDPRSYAAPGGYVFITKGALLRMEDEAELAGVLAREMAHVLHRDVVRYLNIRSTGGPGSAAQLIAGPALPVAAVFLQLWDENNSVARAMEILEKNGYARADEEAADSDAVAYAALAGYDPQGLIRYVERSGPVKQGAAAPAGNATPLEERVARLKAAVQQEGLDSQGDRTGKERFSEVRQKMKNK